MKRLLIFIAFAPLLAGAQGRRARLPEVVVTSYKTTMIADGRDTARLRIRILDTSGNELPGKAGAIKLDVTGDAKIIRTQQGPDDIWITLQAGPQNGKIIVKASADSMYAGSTEIHSIHPGTPHPVTSGPPIAGNLVIKDKIIGADISFLPQLEARGMHFSDDNGKPGEAMDIMKAHGFNYIRLRIFDHPDLPKGYSPKQGFCDLPHTMAMAKRIKAAGLKFLLDIHYSDYWADPQQQNKPAAWSTLDFSTLKDSVYAYTRTIMQALKDQGTAPDMVQVGNEINHGILWPDGAIGNLDSLAQLLFAGIRGVKDVSPSTAIMLHIALGGQNEESRFFIDNMLARKVPFDVIGLSYYPRWHGTPDDLKNNMADLAKRYHKYVMVAEYSQYKELVNDIAFTAPGKEALGTFIWEPLSTWEAFFDRTGKATPLLDIYVQIAQKYVH